MSIKVKVYQEYQQAAERHYKTCLKLEETIQSLQGNSSNNKLVKKLLQNLYYLTGYIIECSCCYFIYAQYANLTDKKALIATMPGKCRENVSFDKNHKIDSDTFIIKGDNHGLLNFTETHSYFGQSLDNIPLINGHISAFQDSEQLLKKWGAEVRYKVEIPLNESNTFSFLAVAKTMYNNINSHINQPNNILS